MADLTITAANVVKGENASTENGTAGAAVTAGQAVYLDDATGKFLLSDNDAAGKKTVRGIALHAAAANQPLAILKSGEITIGATLTAGSPYYLSDTPGGLMPAADLDVGMDVVLIGLAKTTTVLAVNIQRPSVTL